MGKKFRLFKKKKLRTETPTNTSDSHAETYRRALESTHRDILADEHFMEMYSRFKSCTMTSIERMKALYDACLYALNRGLPGDYVECGVWKGGSSMLMAQLLAEAKSPAKMYLYDTFDGMPAPSNIDADMNGTSASQLMQEHSKEDQESVWCYAGLEEVKHNINQTSIDPDNVVFCKGLVEDTIPNTIPDSIAVLRLDTDFYSSTKHELEHLYPRLVPGGILLIDDYGYWEGCKKAVDEFFGNMENKPLIQRIDLTGRLIIKPQVMVKGDL